jgi:hypothetical protein
LFLEVCCNGVCCEVGQVCDGGQCKVPCGGDICEPNETCCDGGGCVNNVVLNNRGTLGIPPPNVCSDGDIECPVGCCPEPFPVCCSDNMTCAATLCDCPPV